MEMYVTEGVFQASDQDCFTKIEKIRYGELLFVSSVIRVFGLDTTRGWEQHEMSWLKAGYT